MKLNRELLGDYFIILFGMLSSAIFATIALSLSHNVYPFEPTAWIRILEATLAILAACLGIERSRQDAINRCKSPLEWIGNAAIVIGGIFFAFIFIKIGVTPGFFYTFTVNTAVAWVCVILSYAVLIVGVINWLEDVRKQKQSK